MTMFRRGGETAKRIRLVKPDTSGGWVVLIPNTKEAISHHPTDDQAVAWTTMILQQSGGGTIIWCDARGGAVRREDVAMPANTPLDVETFADA